MTPKPILFFPEVTRTSRSKKNSNHLSLVKPSKEEQVRSFDRSVSNLEREFRNQTVRFDNAIQGLVPEMILVFEIAGTIEEFYKAVEETSGMEYLAEYPEEKLEEATGFYYRAPDGEIKEGPVERRVFVTMNSQAGITELLAHWHRFKYGEDYQKGTTKFRNLFAQLMSIRPYNIYDRIKDTGLELYLDELKAEASEIVNFEIEFTFHASAEQRNLILAETEQFLAEVDGRLIFESISVIPEIKYFGAVASAPIIVFDDLTENTNIQFLQSHRILYFKPVGQGVGRFGETEKPIQVDEAEISKVNDDEKIHVALLDGMPLQNHRRLANKLVIDDPDSFSTNYLPEARIHGTLMASLILQGDIDAPTLIKSKLYVRPVLKPVNSFGTSLERIPGDRLIIDLIHRSIKRLFEKDGETPPSAPDVKIVNLSIADEFKPFLRSISSWAKLLDYLSFKYKFLFILSGGNYTEEIKIPVSLQTFESISAAERELLIYQALFEQNYERKILTPSESINSLCIGGAHSDFSEFQDLAGYYNPDSSDTLPSTISRIGYGFNRALKPDMLFASGRTLYRITRTNTEEIFLKLNDTISNRPPGIKVAIPGQAGSISSTGYTVGTSLSAALTTNKAGQLYDLLDNLNDQGENEIGKEYYAVLIKTLLIHYCESDTTRKEFEKKLESHYKMTAKILKEYTFQNIGNGILNARKLGFCTDQRVTLIGFGKLKKDEGHIYKFPLPNVLSGKKIKKRIIITLGWISPVNFSSGKYKMADFFFDNIKASQDDLILDRAGSDVYVNKRGTVQHDILENENADVYVEGSDLVIKISCRENASGLKTRENKYETEYGVAVTLELEDSSKIEIYNEIKTTIDAIRVQLKAKVRIK